MRYFFTTLLLFVIGLSFSQNKEQRALELKEKYLKIEHNIVSFKLNNLNDTISFYSDVNGSPVKITALINGIREYYYYDSNNDWPFLVVTTTENLKNTFFFNYTEQTSLLFKWNKNGIKQPEESKDFITKDDYFFKNGRNLKTLVENQLVNKEVLESIKNYSDSLNQIHFKIISTENRSKDTLIMDDFEETEQIFKIIDVDSSFLSVDGDLKLSKKTYSNSFSERSYNYTHYTNLVKSYSLSIEEEKLLMPSYRKRDNNRKGTTTIIFKRNNECFTGTSLLMDNTLFYPKWEQQKCD